MLFWDHLAMFGAVGSSVLAIRLLIDVQDLRTHLNLLNNGMNLLRDEVSALEARLGIKPFEAPSASETPRPPMHEDIPLQTAPPQAPQILTDPWKKRATSSFPKPSNGPGWENVLAENWLVWLGGIALALGGAFMVKLSIDQGYLTPLVRVVLGTILGIAMSVGAEWISRDDRLAASRRIPFYIPSALASAGAVTTFASFYAAYQLYDLIPAPLAFVLLALSASMTVIMSLRHGVLLPDWASLARSSCPCSSAAMIRNH